MSATLDSRAVSAFFDDCPVIEVPGRPYPLDVGYAPGEPIGDAAADVLRATDGQLLCFLPGAAEIGRAIAEIERRTPGVEIVALHGSLDAADQDRALAPAPGRRIVVATNIAETSLTVPGVTAVIDTGLHKVARYDGHRGIDSLETERITADAADQRAGRAGRIAPGVVRRLWDARDRLRPHREPEIHRIDLGSRARRHRLGRRSANARMVRAAAGGRARRGAIAAGAARPDHDRADAPHRYRRESASSRHASASGAHCRRRRRRPRPRAGVSVPDRSASADAPHGSDDIRFAVDRRRFGHHRCRFSSRDPERLSRSSREAPRARFTRRAPFIRNRRDRRSRERCSRR
ncbi:MAG: hypothetical protein DMG01_16670 [Acidobacteria bacterium]|nr:MAG: hypothetical protein DMG01_16670 [Acidobacteriota bacterium]